MQEDVYSRILLPAGGLVAAVPMVLVARHVLPPAGARVHRHGAKWKHTSAGGGGGLPVGPVAQLVVHPTAQGRTCLSPRASPRQISCLPIPLPAITLWTAACLGAAILKGRPQLAGSKSPMCLGLLRSGGTAPPLWPWIGDPRPRTDRKPNSNVIAASTPSGHPWAGD